MALDKHSTENQVNTDVPYSDLGTGTGLSPDTRVQPLQVPPGRNLISVGTNPDILTNSLKPGILASVEYHSRYLEDNSHIKQDERSKENFFQQT